LDMNWTMGFLGSSSQQQIMSFKGRDDNLGTGIRSRRVLDSTGMGTGTIFYQRVDPYPTRT
jgi:hypothetical protein